MDHIVALLAQGEIDLRGQVPWSSNYAFIVVVGGGQEQIVAVYKPARGEQPLWDFPAGSLCRREVATYLLSQSLGWPHIPPVALRDGPYGLGSVQLFVPAEFEEHYFTLRDHPGYEAAFRRIALLDYMVNNADRKGGHVLRGRDERIWAIDHGLTFHTQPKLRTVIWEYAGQPIERELLDTLQELRRRLVSGDSSLRRELSRVIATDEIAAFERRLDRLLARPIYPLPRQSWRNVPYPLV